MAKKKNWIKEMEKLGKKTQKSFQTGGKSTKKKKRKSGYIERMIGYGDSKK